MEFPIRITACMSSLPIGIEIGVHVVMKNHHK